MDAKLRTEQALERFRKHPKLFFKEVLGCELEIYQDEALQIIADNDRIAISACHDLGKSWLLARVVLWFVSCYPYSKVITTAPTYNQVKNILWSEIRSAYSRAKFPLGGKMNLTEWQVTKEGDWFAIGFTPRNELSGENGQGAQSSFQGFHAPYILIVFDEATGIPYPIWTMTEGMLTSGNVKFVAIGNPTSRQSEFYRCFSSPDWTKLQLNCFHSPNLLANGITNLDELKSEISRVRALSDTEAHERLRSYRVVKNYLLSLKWVVSMGLPRKWGVDHPLFVSKVLGAFPADSDDTLIPLGIVEQSQMRVAWPSESDRKTIGLDVARFGSDSSVWTALHGRKFLERRTRLHLGTPAVVGETIDMARSMGGVDVIVVDETGIGGGTVDMLLEAKNDVTGPNRELLRNTEIRGVQFGAGCELDEDKDKFVNIKARMFRLLADDLKDANGLTLPQDADIYLEELPTIRFGYDSKGRMFIESKDEYKKRTGRKSPDDSDSLALANFGRYDEMSSGDLTAVTENTAARNSSSGYARPFAASLGSGKQW